MTRWLTVSGLGLRWHEGKRVQKFVDLGLAPLESPNVGVVWLE
jgi:hypothetical protein